MKQPIYTFTLLFLSLFTQSGIAQQQHYYYAPNTVHVPVLNQKNDAAITLGIGRGSGFRALELQGVYSPIKHLAIMANYFGGGDSQVKNLTEIGASGRSFDVGIGGYQAMNNGSSSLFVGVSEGSVLNHYGNETKSELKMRRWFVQPGVTYNDNFFRGGIAIRINRLEFVSGETDFKIDENELNAIRNIEKQAPFFLPELGVHVGMNFYPFSLNLCLSTIFPKTYGLRFSRFNSCFSLTYYIGKKKKAEVAETTN